MPSSVTGEVPFSPHARVQSPSDIAAVVLQRGDPLPCATTAGNAGQRDHRCIPTEQVGRTRHLPQCLMAAASGVGR